MGTRSTLYIQLNGTCILLYNSYPRAVHTQTARRKPPNVSLLERLSEQIVYHGETLAQASSSRSLLKALQGMLLPTATIFCCGCKVNIEYQLLRATGPSPQHHSPGATTKNSAFNSKGYLQPQPATKMAGKNILNAPHDLRAPCRSGSGHRQQLC